MFQDRRDSPRHPALIRTHATVGRERFDVVCTDTGPSGGFFTTRNPPTVGGTVEIELRAGGVDSPIVTMHARVVRTSLPGSPGPVGFGVAWQSARCELGPEPLFWVLRHVLHIAVLGDASLTQGRSAVYAFGGDVEPRPLEDPHGVTPRTSPVAAGVRNSSVHQAIGVWSPPMHRATVPREAQGPDTARQPAQHPVHLEPQAPLHSVSPAGSRAPSALVAATPAITRPELFRHSTSMAPIQQERSQVFGGLDEGPSATVGRTAESSTRDDVSQSWPVYALAPGERRAVSDPDVGTHHMQPRPVQAPTARHADGAVASESIGGRPQRAHSEVARHPIVAQTARPSSQPFDGLAERTDPADRPRAPARKSESGRMLAAADVPVTILRQNQFLPAQLTGIAEQLACVVTQGEAPDLDEQLVIHLPVRVDNAWRSVQLVGKLLQVATDTPSGKRFIMHIERADEGRHRGAFRAFLAGLDAP